MFDDIVEVVQGRLRYANWYLEHGYRLLAVTGTTWQERSRAGNEQWVMRRGITYSMGRTKDVEHVEPPPPEFEPREGHVEAAAPAPREES